MIAPRHSDSKRPAEDAEIAGGSRFAWKRLGTYSGIAGSMILLLVLHYSTTPERHTWHNIYTELHYIPLLIAAMAFGMRGALVTYGAILVLYLPILFNVTASSPVEFLNKVVHLSFSGLFSAWVGYLVHRERQMRQRAEEAKYLAGVGQAAASIVHDLKNPLIVASGFSKRIREGRGDPKENVIPVIESIGDMERIVTDVLDVTRKPKPDVREHDLGKVVEAACDCCAGKAERKGVSITMEIPSETAALVTDALMLKRSLVNLIDNAIDASRPGQSVAVTIEADQSAFRIGIGDEGSGMDADTLAHLFTPFYSKKGCGTGLGMAIAKKYMDALGGTIEVQSQAERGTAIRIGFPRNHGLTEAGACDGKESGNYSSGFSR